jgi:MFS family permease
MSLAQRFWPLRERNFLLLWAGQSTSILGNAVVPIAIAFAVLDLTHSVADLGYVLAAQSVPLVVFLLVGGVWADRLPRQLVMIASDVVRCGVQTTIAVLLFTSHPPIWELAALMATFGTAQAFFEPAFGGLVPSTVSSARLQQANALFMISSGSAWVAGPAVAGILIAVHGPALAIAFDAGTFALSALSLLALRLPWAAGHVARQSFLTELAEGWQEVRSRTWIWTIIAWVGSYFFLVIAPFLVLGPAVARASLGGATAWAIISASLAAGRLVGGATALNWTPSRPLFVASALLLLQVPPVALLAGRGPLVAIVPAQVLGGASIGFFFTIWDTALQRHIAPEKLSRVSSYDWIGVFVLQPAGLALVGPVAAAIGISTTLWIAAAWAATSTILVLLVREIRELRFDGVAVSAPAAAAPLSPAETAVSEAV